MRQKRLSLLLALSISAVALAGCEYAGPGDDNPIARNLTWFSYVGGENMKKACAPGASDTYRFVYNGIYDKQIRTYDVRVHPDGRSADVSAWARGEGDLTRARPILQIGRVWSGDRASAEMPASGLSSLRAALVDDGFQTERPVGLRLPSNEFYWTAVACVDGRFVANAWLYPSTRFKRLKFPAVLENYDKTGVAFYAPRPSDQQDEDPTLYSPDQSSKQFFMQLGRDGFVGTDAPF